ncbi:MAG TPA: lipoprotein signal peptidase [Saprospirales bacterium]|nr:lipoprotein signal peptidase [Saprospirales bacterium]
MKKGYLAALVVLVVLIIDQASKFYIKTHFEYNEDLLIFGQNWARLHFVENEGMAFGITFGWEYGKLLLSLFRILMVAGLIWYTRLLLAANAPTGFVISIGLITAGALGNIIDSAIYAMIFSDSTHHIAQLVPWGTGYGMTNELPMGGFMHGKVVDMLYFPIKYIEMPEWLGGDTWLFFSPIFNVADAAITTGVLSILLFQRRFFKDGFVDEKPDPQAAILAEIDRIDEKETEQPAEENQEQPLAADENTDTTESDKPAQSEGSQERPLL